MKPLDERLPRWPPDWPRSSRHPRANAVLKAAAEDFQVDEIPLVSPEGEGSHLWLHIEKTGANTDWVSRQFAACAGVPPRDVGYAGMKDRHAVTRQWFSVACQEAANTDWREWRIDGVSILSAARHPRKLKRGTLRGNRFTINLRSVEGDRAALETALQEIAERGVPNYFGPQRFGHHGANLERAGRWLAGASRVQRNKRSLYLSVARSFLFNQVLAHRVRSGHWDRLLDGDVAMLDGRSSVFVCDLSDAGLHERCATGEIHPAGPLFGEGGLASEREAARVQAEVLEPYAPIREGLCKQGVKGSWRSLRLRVTGLQWAWQGDSLQLVFELPAGAYATVLLAELVSFHDASI